MRTTLNFHRSESPQFDVSSLARFRQQSGNLRAQDAQHYTVVLLEGAGQSTTLPLTQDLGLTELYFVAPGQPTWPNLPEWAEGQVLQFTDAFACLTDHERELLLFQLFHNANAEEPVQVSGEQAAELDFLLSSMKRQADGASLLRDDLLRAYLKTLLLYCTRLRQQQFGVARPLVQLGLFGRFQQLLEGNYTKWKSVAEYADQLHVTPNHLSVSVRKETGRPASDHIRSRIVLEAQRLVARTDASLKQVAYQLGFEDVAHFSKLFKRCTGVTFSHFKEQTRTQYRFPAPNLMVA
ncbi:helix-turn-helix domain-containing protein [Hymenobacter sp. GOD-10R]|uniref:helix-turn-helix domain-containing protein n=1 Tax=Hymenobacter sp. GOD-10R TaxID=3093922 RepID=UPI002D79936F|nr:helix-turn-helix domain-containing protein [Hymenobacter sp. GOD-10R]WRQ29031.1 helix-turn-helix domain-containing protein [Hymenobacter sp. GOD-10R]